MEQPVGTKKDHTGFYVAGATANRRLSLNSASARIECDEIYRTRLNSSTHHLEFRWLWR